MATAIVCDMAEILFLFGVGPVHNEGSVISSEDFDVVMY